MIDLIINTLGRTVISFIALLLFARILGTKAVTQMTSFDFVVSIVIGSIGASAARGSGKAFYVSITALIGFFLLALICDYFSIWSFIFRKAIDSEPIVLIKNGKIINENMKNSRITITKLTSLLREKSIFNISDVEFALLESNGELSVLPKSQKQPLTPSDLKIPTKYEGLTTDLIIDGNIMDENLNHIHLDRQWLLSELEKQGISNPKDVFFAGLDTAGNLYVSKRIHGYEEEGEYGIE